MTSFVVRYVVLRNVRRLLMVVEHRETALCVAIYVHVFIRNSLAVTFHHVTWCVRACYRRLFAVHPCTVRTNESSNFFTAAAMYRRMHCGLFKTNLSQDSHELHRQR